MIIPGMKIICVKVIPVDRVLEGLFGGEYPVLGRIYTASWVGATPFGGVVDLAELPSPETYSHYRGYIIEQFRPIVKRKTDISAFKALLNTTPMKEST